MLYGCFGLDRNCGNPVPEKMKNVGRMGIHYLQRLNAENVPKDLIEKGQARVIEASLTLIRERAKLKVYFVFKLPYVLNSGLW